MDVVPWLGLVLRSGGIVANAATKNTDVIVRGTSPYGVAKTSGVKLLGAEAQRERRKRTLGISERQFRRLVSSS